MNEKMKLNFDFYYGKDAEQFNFYRIMLLFKITARIMPMKF